MTRIELLKELQELQMEAVAKGLCAWLDVDNDRDYIGISLKRGTDAWNETPLEDNLHKVINFKRVADAKRDIKEVREFIIKRGK